MKELTQLISTEIKKQYKSVRQFALAMGIPQTTVASALKNGVSGTSYETVLKICKALDIKLINYESHVKITDEMLEDLIKMNSLDAMGIHTVKTILNMEYDRYGKGDDITRNAAKVHKVKE